MKHRLSTKGIALRYATLRPKANIETTAIFPTTDKKAKLRQQYIFENLEEFLTKLNILTGKESFLVFKNNKYISIRTGDIAFFYVKNESTNIVTFSNLEFSVNYSLEQIQHLLPGKQFFRLNRQYLVSFNVIKEVEHYFNRKLLINAIVPTKEKLIVPKEKATSFLHWLDNR
jgi:two-component system response regulator LytT